MEPRQWRGAGDVIVTSDAAVTMFSLLSRITYVIGHRHSMHLRNVRFCF